MPRKKYREPKNLVIVGAGFAGVTLARKLGRNKNYNIKLLSDSDNFRFYPALYRSATGHSRLESSMPLSFLLYTVPRVEFIKDKIGTVDTKNHTIKSEAGTEYKYDILVLALGVVTNYFGVPGLEQYCYGIKSIDEVLRLRQHLHNELLETGHLDKQYVVVGAGATGVELSAALVTYLRNVAKMHSIPHEKITIDLIEAAPRVLPRMSEKTSLKVSERLRSLGVNIMTGKHVQGESPTALTVDGNPLPTETVIWTAGVANNPFYTANASQFKVDDHHKIVVDSHMKATDDVFVLGDNASTPNSGLALTAVRDGKYLASYLNDVAYGDDPRPYKVKQPITVIPVGANWSVLEYRGLTLSGWPIALVRSAADLFGYLDIAPTLIALTLWLVNRRIDDDCMICRQNNS